MAFTLLNDSRKAFLLLNKAQRQRWYRLVPLALLGSVLEILALMAVFFLISLFSLQNAPLSSNLTIPVPLQSMDRHTMMITLSLFIAVLFLVKNSLRLWEVYLRELYARHAAVSIAQNLLSYYLRAPYQLHYTRNSAELIRNVQQNSTTISQSVLLSSIAAGTELIVIAGICAVLMYSEPTTTLLAFLIIGGLMAAILMSTQHFHSIWGQQNFLLHKHALQTLQQCLAGIKEIKLLKKERFFLDRYINDSSRLAALEGKRSTLSSVPRLAVETIFVLAVMLFIAGVEFFGTASGDLLAVLGLFTYAGFRLLPSFHMLVYHLNNIKFGAAALQSIEQDYRQLRNLPPGSSTTSANNENVFNFNRHIEFHDVRFRYPQSADDALQNINIKIAFGQTIGIVGASGAGKSTFIDLLLGLLKPGAGRISVDSEDLSDNPDIWQSHIGYVPQNIYLSDDSIRNNIAFGVPEQDIDDKRIDRALQLAQLHDYVAQLPQGSHSPVGELGIRLSGGQRQRIVIARALYNDPKILIFDEATAALDNQTEHELSQAIETLHAYKTVFVVAHRISTIQHCDLVLFFHQGRLIDHGDYQHLMRNPLFQQITRRRNTP